MGMSAPTIIMYYFLGFIGWQHWLSSFFSVAEQRKKIQSEDDNLDKC